MKLLRVAWKSLVAIKDLMVLAFLLLFFGGLFAVLNSRPHPGAVKPGALLLKLDGSIVEQPSAPQGLAALNGNSGPKEYRLRDVLRAIDAAKGDDRVKAVVLDLDSFTGGYPAALGDVSRALAAVRASGKPVLAYAGAYSDSAYRLASAASEIWTEPMGGALFRGPGGSQLYYKGLIDKLGVNVHVYRVGKYKSFVEPYTRADASPEAKEEDQALYGAILADWKALVHGNRPKAQIDNWLGNAAGLIAGAKGDLAQAGLNTGLVDRIGSRVDFGKRVAVLAGAPAGKAAGSYNTIAYDDWLSLHPLATRGDAIGVLTIAGDIIDGKAGPGTAAGDTISKLMLDGLATGKLKALVVRIDSPGGSTTAVGEMTQAIETAKASGIPVVVSMGSVAASAGYWVATPADVIYAEPNTITGSIGIFGIIPTFENALKKIGVTSDGVRTTPLSGQPDVFAGTSPESDAVLQSMVDYGYRAFITRVARARHKTPEQVDAIGQGRVWIGNTAKGLGLVDRFGTMDDALAEAARRAGLKAGGWHAEYLEKKPGAFAQVAAALAQHGDDDDARAPDAFARLGMEQRTMLAAALGDTRRLLKGGAIQARCLACAGLGAPAATRDDRALLDLMLAKLGL